MGKGFGKPDDRDRPKPNFSEREIQETFHQAAAYHRRGQITEAIASYRKVVRLKPDWAEAYFRLGLVLREQERQEEALAYYRQALQLDPNYQVVQAELFSTRALIYHRQGKLEEAIADYDRALELNRDSPRDYCNLGVALKAQGQLERAVACYRQALKLNPHLAPAYNNLGLVLQSQGKLDLAIENFRVALQLEPDLAAAYNNLGLARQEQGYIEEAIDCFQKAIAIASQKDYCFNYALALLLSGNLPQGWSQLAQSQLLISDKIEFEQPYWDGSSLLGKRILLHTIHGKLAFRFGDTIQLIRYAPLVKKLGARVIFACPTELKTLLASCAGIDELISDQDVLPEFDVHAPLMTLPGLLGTDIGSIPDRVPYLQERIEPTHPPNISCDRRNLKVGLVWACSNKHPEDLKRSCPLSMLEPLWQIPGVTFFSLQKGLGLEELPLLPSQYSLIELGSQFQDFTDTAWAIFQLDLIICVDTAVAHLAGALAKPTWVLLPFVPDWRWFLGRSDSPWYPTVRLFRQPQWGDWYSVVAQVAEALHLFRKTKAEGQLE
jgi:tetratricopeptide (TPR) repeat protein